MITDKNIDKSTAKFWCIFADKDFKRQIKKAQEFDVEKGKNLKDVFAAVERKAESLKAESKQVSETKGPLDGNTFLGNFMNPQNMMGMSGNPFCPNLRSDAPLSLEDQQRNTVIAGAAVAAGAAVVANPGAWGALGTAVMGLISGSSWLAGIVAQVGLAGLSAGLAAAVGGVVSISSWLYPRLAKWLKDIARTGIIAKCSFVSNGTPYVAVYSLSKNKWQLLYGNNRWFRRETKVDDDSVDSFFSTEFFDKFTSKCKEYMSPVIDDEDGLKTLETVAKMADKSSAKLLQKILDNRSLIQSNLYTGTYIMESMSNDSN